MTVFSNLKLYYYPLPARGEFITLLLDDASIEYEHNTIGFGEPWEKKKAEMMAQGIPAPTLPYLTIDGKYMGKTTPIMRYISKQIGKYLADNDMDNQYLDSLADICMDWYMLWVDAHYVPGSSPETESKFHIERSPFFHTSFENVLSKSSGPYVLGEKITYTDFVIYNCMVEDGLHKKLDDDKFPNLKKLSDAIESRPSLQKHFSKS